MNFDYLIVGAGSAGCVLANRLTENLINSVALFEAGGSSDIWKVKMPLALLYAMHDPKYNYFNLFDGFQKQLKEVMFFDHIIL